MKLNKLMIAMTCALTAFATAPAFAQDAERPDHPEVMGDMQPPPPTTVGVPRDADEACPTMEHQWRHHGWEHGHDGMHDLHLSDEQNEKLYQIHRAQMAKTAGWRSDLMQSELDLHDAMLQATVDRTKVMSIAKHIADLKTNMEMAKVESSIETMAVLTPEQRLQMRHSMMRKFSHMGMLGMH